MNSEPSWSHLNERIEIELLPGAWQDLEEAHDFYLRSEGLPLAQEFRAEVEEALETIAKLPGAWPVRLGAHRCLLRRFPFSVFYSIENGRIVVAAVAHHKRRTGYWKG